MIMITRRKRPSPIPRELFRNFSRRLAVLGLRPLSVQMEEQIAQLALGAVGEHAAGRILPGEGEQDGDFLFVEDAVLYYRYYRPRSLQPMAFEVGAIHKPNIHVEGHLDRLASLSDLALSDASRTLKVEVDPTVRWEPLAWRPTSNTFARIKQEVSEDPEERGVHCVPGFPRVLPEERAALEALSGQDARKLALRIKASDPVFAIKADEAMEIGPLVESLITSGLIEKRVLVRCKKFNDRSLVVASPDEVGRLRGSCPHCQRSLSEEMVTEGLAAHPLCGRLLDGSRWMSLTVSEILVNQGISDDDALVAQPIGDEEVDFFLNLFGSFAVAELKDRVFSLEDSRDLIDRYLRFEADELIAITTETLAPEARRRLDEFGASMRRSDRSIAVSVIEGVASFEPSLRQIVTGANWRAVSKLIRSIDLPVRVNVSYLVASKFGIPAEVIANVQESAPRLLWAPR